MQFFNKLTQAQQLVLQAVVAMLGSALTATFTAAYQYFQSGNVNLGNTTVFGLTTFFVLFGGALYSYVPAHVQVEMQALADSVTALRAYNSTLQQAIPHPTPTSVSQPQQAPVEVHVHNYGTPVVSSSSAPPASLTTPPVSSDPVVIQSPFDNVAALATSYKPVSLVSVPMEHPPTDVAPTALSTAGMITSASLQGVVAQPATASAVLASPLSMDTMPRAIAHLQKQ